MKVCRHSFIISYLNLCPTCVFCVAYLSQYILQVSKTFGNLYALTKQSERKTLENRSVQPR